MPHYFSSLPSSHLLVSPLGQVLLKASLEGSFSSEIYKGNSERKFYDDNLWPDNQIESRTVTSIHILCWSIIFLPFS